MFTATREIGAKIPKKTKDKVYLLKMILYNIHEVGQERIDMMKPVTNICVYDLEETLVASGYAMIEEYDEDVVNTQVENLQIQMEYDYTTNGHYKRALRLAKAHLNSGHVSFAKGIVVNMDITFTNKAWIELQRYHFIDIITGMSTMHRISKFDLDEAFNEYTDQVIIDRLKEVQQQYLDNPSKENYLKLLYSTPSGLLMTGRVTTNYLQLMNIVQQRKNHRLPEWREFCQQLIDELPLFKELLIANGIIEENEN